MGDQLPPHMTPEYIAENKQTVIIGVIVGISIVSTCFVLARSFTRIWLTTGMLLDDWLVVVSQIAQWVCVGLATDASVHGNGRHFDAMLMTAPEDLERALFYTMLNFPFGILAFALPKIAVVVLLTRIMNPSRKHRWFLWGLTLFCFVVLNVCSPILFLQCTPSYSQWDLSFPPEKKKCWDSSVLVNYATVAGSLSAFTDLYLAVYPATVLWSLRLGLKKKIALSIALGIGSISCVVAIYKCTRLPSLASADFTWDTADLIIWTVIEAAVIIIACCIPLLQPFVDFIFGRRVLGSTQSYKQYGSSHNGSHQPRSKSATELSRRGKRHGATDVSRVHGGDFDNVDDMQTRAGNNSSQDSILPVNVGQATVVSSMEPADSSAGSEAIELEDGPVKHGEKGIVKTREIKVEYSKNNSEQRDPNGNWSAV